MSESEKIMVVDINTAGNPVGAYIEADKAVHISKKFEIDKPRPAQGRELEEIIERKHHDIENANRRADDMKDEMRKAPSLYLRQHYSALTAKYRTDVCRYELDILIAERQLHNEQCNQSRPSDEYQKNIEHTRKNLKKLEQQKIRKSHKSEQSWQTKRQSERERLRKEGLRSL